ncbi:MAG: hypothetical protein LC624_02225 [Halobacteriales archaeon]|nr:hypothetical protein [Halobacteriales archaeon]
MAELVQVREGGTTLWVPEGHTQHGPAPRASALGLFYNRAAARNRDVGVLYMAARHGCSDRRVLDALAGSGARGVRWCVEAKLSNVTLNDRSPAAAEAIQRNLAANGAQAAVLQRDVHALLAEECFRHVELDPYGTPAPFLDAAFRGLGREGGVSFTATDTAALCGANAAPCLRRYGAVPTRVEELCHEVGLRILVAHAVREAAKHDQAALPVLSASREHYFRVYVETRRLSQLADQQLRRIRWLVHCQQCLHRGFDDAPSKACPSCGGAAQASGPMWSGPLWSADLLRHMEHLRPSATLALPRAIERDLALWGAEQEAQGLPWHLQDIASFAGVAEPPRTERLVQELRRMGHAASGTHLDGRFVRTPAPAKDVVQAVREAAR